MEVESQLTNAEHPSSAYNRVEAWRCRGTGGHVLKKECQETVSGHDRPGGTVFHATWDCTTFCDLEDTPISWKPHWLSWLKEQEKPEPSPREVELPPCCNGGRGGCSLHRCWSSSQPRGTAACSEAASQEPTTKISAPLSYGVTTRSSQLDSFLQKTSVFLGLKNK